MYDTLKVLPHEDYIYYADTANVPYGPKPKEDVRKYIFDAVDFIVEQGVKAVVIACNTATSVAIEDLRARYDIPIIGMEPAVKPAVEKTKCGTKRVLVTATALTLKEEKLHNLITRVDDKHIVDLLPLPGLVHYAEGLDFSEETLLAYLSKELTPFDLAHYETIVLGCTHFSYYKDMFKKLLPPTTYIIDGNLGTANQLKRLLKEQNLLNQGTGDILFYNSGEPLECKHEKERYRCLFERLEQVDQIMKGTSI